MNIPWGYTRRELVQRDASHTQTQLTITPPGHQGHQLGQRQGDSSIPSRCILGRATATKGRDPLRRAMTPHLRAPTHTHVEDTLPRQTTKTLYNVPLRLLITRIFSPPRGRALRSHCGDPLRKCGTRTHYKDSLQGFSQVPESSDTFCRCTARIHSGNVEQGHITMIYYKDFLRSRSPATRFADALPGSTAEMWNKDTLQGFITRIFSGPGVQRHSLQVHYQNPLRKC